MKQPRTIAELKHLIAKEIDGTQWSEQAKERLDLFERDRRESSEAPEWHAEWALEVIRAVREIERLSEEPRPVERIRQVCEMRAPTNTEQFEQSLAHLYEEVARIASIVEDARMDMEL